MASLARSVRAWGPIALVVLVVDQITKTWALRALDDQNIDLVWTLRLNLAFNTGMAFGSADGWGPVIGILGLVVVVTLVLSLRSTSGRWSNVAVGLIVGGALGNLADRLFRSPGWFRGAVVDFIDLQWWPIFNVADMGIVCGGILLVVLSWHHGRTGHPSAEPGEPVAP